MDFDWNNYHAEGISQEEIAESFEDPFCVRLLPDRGPIAGQSRYFCLGMTLRGRALFCVYSTNGKLIRVRAARPMTAEEAFFYNRKSREYL
jgi:uncharacterized DUF497 family protein